MNNAENLEIPLDFRPEEPKAQDALQEKLLNARLWMQANRILPIDKEKLDD